MHIEGRDADAGKGAVEQDKPEQKNNTSLSGQLPHRPENKMIDGNDTDFPEPGENPEHSGEPQEQSMASQDDSRKEKKTQQKTAESNPEGVTQDQEPGQRQKQNQGETKEDDLAA